MTNNFIDCPCCNAGVIRVKNGKIDRHEQGLRFIPYRLYHALESKSPGNPRMTVHEQMLSNLCPASGKTEQQAMEIYRVFMLSNCNECQSWGKCPKQDERGREACENFESDPIGWAFKMLVLS